MSIERLKAMKERAMSLAEQGLNQDVSCIDAKELGEVVDVVKDLNEALKLCHEAQYYEKINKAMDESTEEDKTTKMMEKYLPEMSYARNYSPYYTMARGSRGRMNYSGGMSNGGNSSGGGRYYTMPYDEVHYMDDGDSWKYRRNYMDDKKKDANSDDKMKDLEMYMKSLSDDIMEMIEDSSTQEKTALKQKLTTLASKI